MWIVIVAVACSDDNGPEEQVDLCAQNMLGRSDYASLNYGTIGPDRAHSSSVIFFSSPYNEIWATEGMHHYSYVDSLLGYYTMSSADWIEVPQWISDPKVGGLTDVSWDGKRFLFRIGKNLVYTTNRDRSDRRNIFSYSGYMDFPYFSPDGKKIAVSTAERGLLLMNVDGANVHELMTGRQVQWLPDNTMYLHTGGKTTTTRHAILTHLDTLGNRIDSIIMPDFKRYQLSPDAKWIACNDIVAPYSEIYIYNIQSGRKITLEYDSWGAYGWTSDSQFLVYNKWHPCIYTMGNGRLWMADLSGRKRQVTFHP